MIFKNGGEGLTAVTVEEIQADARKKAELIRALAAEFRDDELPAPLTANEKRLASRMTPAFLERGSVISRVVPTLSGMPAEAAVTMRMCAEADAAYAEVLAEAEELVRQVRMGMLRTKLKGVEVARVVYRSAKAYVQTPEGDSIRTHVEEMGRTLPRRKSKPKAKPADGTDPNNNTPTTK